MSSLLSLLTIVIGVFDAVTLGSPFLFGAFIVILFGAISIKAQLPAGAWLAWIFPTIIILVTGNKLPLWAKPMSLIVYGVVFALGWIYIISRR